MTSTTKQAARAAESASLTPGAAGPYMLTLCRLASPVTIRPPQSPHLKPFTFFTSRSRHTDGSERLQLHMGYFGTQEQAQKWAQLMRSRYPEVVVTPTPAEVLRQRGSGIPTLAPAATTPLPAEDPQLSDTQVMRVLTTPPAGSAETESDVVSVLRPDDTDTRRALKEAVVRGAPVSFAVQLMWSDQPIELSGLPGLSIFRAYTLYKTQGNRQGRPWYGLRLGFFDDAISAKQVAYYVRTSFASVAVVPITDEERASGTAGHISATALGDAEPLQQRIDETLESTRPRLLEPETAVPRRATAPRAKNGTLEETLEMLAASEIWTNADSLGETGVRHLKVDFKK